MGLPKLKSMDAVAAIEIVPVKETAPTTAQIVHLRQPDFGAWSEKAKRLGNWAVVTIIPPLITVALLILVWQLAFSKPGASLPSPTIVWAEASDLILQPFYWASSQDIGLGWRVMTSLQRVLVGFGLAAVVGVFVGAVIGQSIWAMRGLDPVFQVLRTVPPLAWLPISLAAFRDSNPSAIFVIFITAI